MRAIHRRPTALLERDCAMNGQNRDYMGPKPTQGASVSRNGPSWKPIALPMIMVLLLSVPPAFSFASSRMQSKTHAFQRHSQAGSSAENDSSVTQPPPTSTPPMQVSEINVVYDVRRPMVYSDSLGRYVVALDDCNQEYTSWTTRILGTQFLPALRAAFVPAGVTPNYYSFIRWRIFQRFVNANIQVVGTQSLLLGLGLKSSLPATAALRWVLKDALGKIVRMLWASRMSGRFDSNAKRWRFRSSLVYAVGNALEIVAYLHPLFLLWATLANAAKQVAYLTNSATRTAVYNSFRTTENIGDITAKGEAQIAMVDLAGMATGIGLVAPWASKSLQHLLTTFGALQVLEIFSVYRLLRSVQYRVLNYERLVQVVREFDKQQTIPTPVELSKTEAIIRPTETQLRRRVAFGSLGRALMNPDELQTLVRMFRKERFLLVIGANVKTHNRRERSNCHIVLHADATNLDIVKSTLALHYLRQSLTPEITRCQEGWNLLEDALQKASDKLPVLLRLMTQKGWQTPTRNMIGQVKTRAEWPLES